MIKFVLPGIFSKFEINRVFFNYIDKHPEFLYPNRLISAVYGTFPYSIWDGGRRIPSYCTQERIIEERDFYNSRGISLRFTFTNSLIEESHLNDSFCNLCLSICNNGMNGVIIHSKLTVML